MISPQILIVDDDESIRLVLGHILQREGYLVDTASSGQQAAEMVHKNRYDVILLDLHMDHGDGLDVLRTVKEQDDEAIVIILTGYSSLENAVECLRLGAYDYLFKPALPDVILKRVHEGIQYRRRRLQRSQLLNQISLLKDMLAQIDLESNAPPAPNGNRFLRKGDLLIDLHHRTATLNDSLLDLTTTEFDILVCLVKASPQPLSPVDLVQCALGYETLPVEARELIKWHIHHLRKKLEPNPKAPRYIKTIRQRGYMWAV